MSLLGTHIIQISPSNLKGTPSHVLPVVLRIKKTLIQNQMQIVAEYIPRQQNLPGTSKNITGSHFKLACVPSLSTLWAKTDNNTWFVRKYFHCFFVLEERPSLHIVPLPVSFYWSGQFWSTRKSRESLWLLGSVSCLTICNKNVIRKWKPDILNQPQLKSLEQLARRDICAKSSWWWSQYSHWKEESIVIVFCHWTALISRILIGAGLDSVSGEEV